MKNKPGSLNRPPSKGFHRAQRRFTASGNTANKDTFIRQ